MTYYYNKDYDIYCTKNKGKFTFYPDIPPLYHLIVISYAKEISQTEFENYLLRTL